MTLYIRKFNQSETEELLLPSYFKDTMAACIVKSFNYRKALGVTELRHYN